ncbi:hypothetical protein DENIS_3123 [Desulfonema ishimotonii]|uniref:Uncharacterized protein n=1 Tax=Desulfonema ishimotonii TaxID=45657 RepID=A0A401FYY7_9BACT|nr:hypothetical protein [Desulfonema ishimotonii]GBC62160.1 hypothetical protein DENIS_3123 [Desulfonema ishimotonii]
MKRMARLMVICFVSLLMPAAVLAATGDEAFLSLYRSTAKSTNQLFGLVSSLMDGGETDIAALLGPVDDIRRNSEKLRQLAESAGRKVAADEAGQMALYMNRVGEALRSGTKRHETGMWLARYYLHFNHLLMVSAVTLKEILNAHVQELKAAVSSQNMNDIIHIAEHQRIHAEQMYYTARIFGKKIWQKFANQIKSSADEIFNAAMKNDMAGVKRGTEEIEKPVQMLMQLIK